jgi:hypothetical protein
MDSSTPYFPAFRARLGPLGGRLACVRAATASLHGLAALFAGYFPGLLQPAEAGPGSRQRALPRVAVFWAFLGQVLTRGASCRWAVARLQADAVAAGRLMGGDSAPLEGVRTDSMIGQLSSANLDWGQTRLLEPMIIGRDFRLRSAGSSALPLRLAVLRPGADLAQASHELAHAGRL